jgi:serine protease AprX
LRPHRKAKTTLLTQWHKKNNHYKENMGMNRKNFWLRILALTGFFLALAVFPSYADSIPDSEPRSSTMANPAAEQPRDGIYIHLAAGSFDPLQGTPDLPAQLIYTPEEALAAGTYIVQFNGPVLPEWKEALTQVGVKLGDYLPDYAFLAYMDGATKEQAASFSFVRWIGPYQPAYKLAPGMDTSEPRSYHILLASWADVPAIQTELSAIDTQSRSYTQGAAAVLSGAQIEQVARLPGVLWIEPYHMISTNNDVGGGTIMGGSTAWSNGYTGSGITISVSDTGLDTGDPNNIHQDFTGRVAHISSWPVVYANYGSGCEISNSGADDGAADKESGHGSHVTGSVAGSGAASGGQFKGLAYEATITFQAIEQWTTWTSPNPNYCPNGYYLTGIPDDVRDLLNQVYGWGSRVQNNSWGGGDHGVYDTMSGNFDDFIFNHPDMTVVVSAGNDGTDANKDGYVDENSVSSPGTAKNLITIGASENERTSGGLTSYTWGQAWPSDFPAAPTSTDRISSSRQELAAFSSRGPMNDGRIKPDVVAPGTDIISVRSSQATEDGWGTYNTYYMYMGGTSMASPLTTGAAALVRDYYITTESLADPSAALIKATLINTAVDITGYGNTSQEAGQPIPNNHEGWGLVNVAAATTPGNRAFVDETTGLGTGGTHTYTYFVNAGTPLKVSLVWSDYPANPSASKTLVNDLNLRVTAPDGTTHYLGNVFSGGWSQTGGSADTINNVECVYIQSPTQGQWTVEVIGSNVPQGPQPYALLLTGDVSQREPLAVTAIQPDMAFNNGVLVNAHVMGTGFEDTATVSLRMGATVIPGTNVTVDTSTDTITADFNLTGATPGLYDVRVDNSTEYAVLQDAFRVLDATLPDLSVNKSASDARIDPGNWLTYTISIENAGLVTATGVTFTDTLPVGVILDSVDPACDGGMITLPDGFACTVQPPTMTAGASIDYTVVISVPANVKGTIVNRVTVGSVEEDAYPTNNSDQVSVKVGSAGLYLPLVYKNFPPLPGAPTLDPISNPDNNGDYTLTWQTGSGPTPNTFEVEENDTVIASNITTNSYNITGRTSGTYTYRVRGTNAYGEGGWSNEQTVVVGGGGNNALQNGDFENGQDGSWTEYSSHGWDLIMYGGAPVDPHGGSWLVWLGGDYDDLSTLTQQVTLPTASPTLTYWLWIASAEDTCGNDVGRVYINTTIVDSLTLCKSSNTNGWVQRTIDLSAYAGQSVSLQFYTQTNGAYNSNFFLDDVVIQ